MVASLSGTNVSVETIISLNPYLAQCRKISFHEPYLGALEFEDVTVPDNHRIGGVGPEVYDGYRQGLDSACADVVITTVLSDGVPAVLTSKRAPGKLFGNKWWMQGGAIHSYRRIIDFLEERAEKECGFRPRVQAFIGVFRTCADDRLGSTINLCYVGFVDHRELIKTHIWDKDHTDFKVLTLDTLKRIPKDEQHWYPMFVFKEALTTMP